MSTTMEHAVKLVIVQRTMYHYVIQLLQEKFYSD